MPANLAQTRRSRPSRKLEALRSRSTRTLSTRRTDANAAFRENPELVKAVEAQIALGRFGEPSEIAAVVAFLASDEGQWVTGQTIEASGGYKL